MSNPFIATPREKLLKAIDEYVKIRVASKGSPWATVEERRVKIAIYQAIDKVEFEAIRVALAAKE